MSDLNKFLGDFLNLLQSRDDHANKNANMLFLQHGNGLIYKQERIKQYKNAPQFVYNYVHGKYDLTPKGIIDSLGLLNKDYEKLAEGCHFREGL